MFTASITLVYIRSKSNTECKHVYFSKLNKKCRDYLLIPITYVFISSSTFVWRDFRSFVPVNSFTILSHFVFFVIHVLFHLKYSYELPVSDQKKFLFQSFGIQL
jgi:hypothetical protein